MTPLSNEKLAHVIELAEKLKLASEHKPQINPEIMALIHAQAVQHANDHDLARYIGKELDIESHYVDAALQTIHPSEDQLLAARYELGIPLGHNSTQQFMDTYLEPLLSAFLEGLRALDPSNEYERVYHRIVRISTHSKKGFFGTKLVREEFDVVKAEVYSFKYIEINDARILVICKKEIQGFQDACRRYGITIKITA